MHERRLFRSSGSITLCLPILNFTAVCVPLASSNVGDIDAQVGGVGDVGAGVGDIDAQVGGVGDVGAGVGDIDAQVGGVGDVGTGVGDIDAQVGGSGVDDVGDRVAQV